MLQWLVANPMLDPAWIGPLVDYLQWVKFSEEATEPNLVMKGRTAAALMRRVEEWHGRLARTRRVKDAEWAPSGLPEWEYEEGRFEDGTYAKWTIHELLSAKALYDEGDAMHHCVGTYHYSCSSGHVAIFSLLKQDKTGHWRWLTVEVERASRRIVQARGIYNRTPDDGSLRVLKAWAARAGLDVAAWL